MEIERIEDWTGQDVIDTEGEKVGKLDDVVFERRSGRPVLALVKTGMLGRHLNLIPLSGSRFSRGYVRVAFTKAQLKDAPGGEAGTPSAAEAEAVAAHFGVQLGSEAGGLDLESGQDRGRREAEEAEARDRVDELEELARAKDKEAVEGESDADAARQRASSAQEERDQALAEAAKARRRVERTEN